MPNRAHSTRSIEITTITRGGTVTLYEVRFKENFKIVAREKRGGLGRIADTVAAWIYSGTIPTAATRTEERKPKKEQADAEETGGSTPADAISRRDA